jgi:Tol biopolymer transport system component
LNFTAGQTVPNAVTVKVGSGGAVNLFNSSGCTHSIVDVVGYHAATPTTSVAGVTQIVSVASDGTQADFDAGGPSVSGDGRYVVYSSEASNLVPGDTDNRSDVFVFDRQTAATSRVSVASGGSQANGSSYSPAVSGDGRYVTYSSDASSLVPGDTNGWSDVFMLDRLG